VSYVGGNLPIIVKSPTHSYRIDTIRELVPDARFVLIVRDPLIVFESVVRMWRTMMTLYALEPVPTEDEIREVVLTERPRFEARLADGRVGLPTNRFAEIRYEALVSDPVSTIERLYGLLELGDFDQIRPAIESHAKRHVIYQAKNEVPSGPWQERVEMAWRNIRVFYGYNSQP
jgi:omega-hydroxy-beta-dihydromenaquinone-9 sulfotransferase